MSHTSGTKISNPSVIQIKPKIKHLDRKMSIVSDFNFWLEFKFLLIRHKTYTSYTYKEFTLDSFMSLYFKNFSF